MLDSNAVNIFSGMSFKTKFSSSDLQSLGQIINAKDGAGQSDLASQTRPIYGRSWMSCVKA